MYCSPQDSYLQMWTRDFLRSFSILFGFDQQTVFLPPHTRVTPEKTGRAIGVGHCVDCHRHYPMTTSKGQGTHFRG